MSQHEKLYLETCRYLLEKADEAQLDFGVPERIRQKAEKVLTAATPAEATDLARRARESMDLTLVANGDLSKAERYDEQASVFERKAIEADAEKATRTAKSLRRQAEELREKATKLKARR